MILTQIKGYLMAGVGVLVAILAGIAGFFKLRLEQKKREISDIKKDSLQESMEQLQKAEKAQYEAGIRANKETKDKRQRLIDGDDSMLDG